MPLWLAMLILAATVAPVVVAPKRSGWNGVHHGGVGTLDGITVADVRAAASGDAARASRFADALLRVGNPAGVYRGSEPDIRAVAGPGTWSDGWAVGWPCAWAGISGGVEYDMPLETLEPMLEGPLPVLAFGPGSCWIKEALVYISRREYTGGAARLFWFNGCNLALGVGITLLIWIAARRIRGRVRRAPARAAVVLLSSLLGLAVIFGPAHKVRRFPDLSPRPPRAPSPTFAEVRALSATESGRLQIARALAPVLEGDAADASVLVAWRHDGPIGDDRTGVGWPATWLQRRTLSIRPRILPKDSSHGHLCWRRASLAWQRTDEGGNDRGVRLYMGGLIADVLPAAAAYGGSRALWLLLHGSRVRRRLRDGLCLTCGYEVG